MIKRTLLMFAWIFFVGTAQSEMANISIGELVEAEIIVIGTAGPDITKSANEFSKIHEIHIEETLKGNVGAAPLSLSPAVKLSIQFQGGDRGIFFLHRYPNGKVGLIRFERSDKIEHTRTLMQMRKDPGKFRDLLNQSPHADYNYTLGSVFSVYEVDCPGFPQVASIGKNIPWGDEVKVILDAKPGPRGQFVLKVHSSNPKGPLTTYLVEQIKPYVQFPTSNRVTGPFTLTVDPRLPQKVGTMAIEEAKIYLRSQLSSNDDSIFGSAMVALTKMRDRGSIGIIRKLKKGNYLEVQQFLKMAGELDLPQVEK